MLLFIVGYFALLFAVFYLLAVYGLPGLLTVIAGVAATFGIYRLVKGRRGDHR
jgi:hypothetical protein